MPRVSLPLIPMRGYGLFLTSNRVLEVSNELARQQAAWEERLTIVLSEWVTFNEIHAAVRLFTKNEEAQSGADMVIAVQDRQGRWAYYLVQAKTQYYTGRYQYLETSWTSRNDDGLRQIDRLLQEAKERGMFPLFAFYNNDKLAQMGARVVTLCPKLTLRASSGPPWLTAKSPLGVTLIRAETLLQFLESQVFTPRTYLKESIPMECLLCEACPPSVVAGSSQVHGRIVPPEPENAIDYAPQTWVETILDGGELRDPPLSAHLYMVFPWNS